MLYDEMDWMKVADSLNSSLPEGGQYTNLELKSFQIASSNNSSSSSDNTSTVWSGNGVISADFITIESPNFYSAKDFINNFASIPTYKTGYVSSITKNDSEGGTTYAYYRNDFTGDGRRHHFAKRQLSRRDPGQP